MSKSRRYMVYAMPFEHVNGKLASSSVRCPNTAGGGAAASGGFIYGYRKGWSAVSRFGVRLMCRNLDTHPYTADELSARQLFALSRSVAAAALRDSDKRARITTDFASQKTYGTLQGFATAKVYENEGVLPQQWDV